MLKFSDRRNFARTLAAIALIAAPLLLLLGQLIGPDLGGDGPERLRQIADNEARFVASALIFFFASFFFIPAMLGVMRLLRNGGVTLGQIAAGLVMVGAVAVIGFYGGGIFDLEMATSDVDQTVAAQISDAAEDHPLIFAPVVLFIFGFVLGNLLLAVSLWRRRVIAPPMAALIGVAAILAFIGGETKWVGVAGFAVMLIGYGAIAMKVLATSDEQWEAPAPPPARQPAPPPPPGPETRG